MPAEKKYFGTLTSGQEVSLYSLRSGVYTATLTDFGATLLSLLAPDREGKPADIVLGFSSLADYTKHAFYFGSTIGRVANRIANARFSLDGQSYNLAANNGPNHLHGGLCGFDKRLWQGQIVAPSAGPALSGAAIASSGAAIAFSGAAAPADDASEVVFTRRSPDGEEGYPGNLDVAVRVRLDAGGALTIAYSATSDKRCPVNLTNHAYFNLGGEAVGDILGHELRLTCSQYLPVGATGIPEGAARPVADTLFDFRRAHAIGRDWGPHFDGYDHCYILDRPKSDGVAQKAAPPASAAVARAQEAAESIAGLVEFAWVRDPASGRTMRVATTLPAVQFYTGNFLTNSLGKHGSIYGPQRGFCLETQYYPDSPNRPEFPSCILEPGRLWSHRSVYRFGTDASD